jgi:DNA-binding XRE family transcriptional regulator
MPNDLPRLRKDAGRMMRLAREKLNMSQDQASKEAHVPLATYWRMEQNPSNAHVNVLLAGLHILHLELKDLL